MEVSAPTSKVGESSGGEGGEEDVPEGGGGGGEFDGDEGAFLIHLGRADDLGFHFVVSGGILDRYFGALAESFLKNDHGAASADGVRIAFHCFAGNVNNHRHAHQNALRAATLLGSRRTSQPGPRRLVVRRFRIRYGRLDHSS